jgi:probable rRNA maturation factor
VVEITNLTRFRIDKKYFQKIGEFIFKKLKQSKDVEVSLVFVGDARMRNLNRIYRNIDRTTDVLSFLYIDKKIHLNSPLRGGGVMGEIVISVPRAKKQAQQRGYPLKRELSELFTHGILHLAGYDDEEEKDYDVMIEKQEEILVYLSTK